MNDFKDKNTLDDYAALARQVFVLIRSLSNYRRGNTPSPETAIRHLEIIGDLSEAMHNLPIPQDDNIFARQMTCASMQDFLNTYPQYRQKISSYNNGSTDAPQGWLVGTN